MPDAAESQRTISLTMKQVYVALGTILPAVIAAFISSFVYLDNEFDQANDRQDELNKEMREFTEKMIEVHFGELSQQIGSISEDISTSQELFLTQANAMMAQVEKTATNKVGLENVKEELAEEKTDKQALKQDVDVLSDNVREIWAYLENDSALDPSSIEPAAGSGSTIRPAFKPLRWSDRR